MIGIVDDSDFESELTNCNPSRVIKPDILAMNRGRGIGSTEVPEALRKIIGETANIDGRKEALELAKSFGVSPSSVSAYTAGATSTATIDTPNPDLKNHITDAKTRVAKRARMKLMQSLSHITGEKLSEAKPGELASVARNMSAIIKDMEPDDNNTSGVPQSQFIIYSPQIKQENSFEIINAKE